MAIDGKGKTIMAASNTIDSEEHRGRLFWAIQRIGDQTLEHNMILENVSWETSMSFKLPGGKKRCVDLESRDLPALPIMVNPKKILAHTPLVLSQDLQMILKLNKGEPKERARFS